MLLLFAEQAAGAAEQAPVVVQLVNHYVGGPLNRFELQYTKPAWDWLFAKFGTNAENVFGQIGRAHV